jgi:heavy metal sensor kinase
VSRVPLRVRLTLVFAMAMAVVLAAGGLLLYDRLAGSLDRTLNQSMHARASDIAALVREADSGLRNSPRAAGGGYAQILDGRGRIFDQTPGLRRVPLLTPSQLRRALGAPLVVARARAADEPARLLAQPVTAQEQQLVIVVAAPLALRDEALSGLRNELLAGGPVALLLASLIGYLVAAAALRPVERMRIRADAISDRRLAERLPVPAARDELGRLGATLNSMLERIETGVRREREFLADASHELRTPLSLLRAEVELALEEPRSQSELVAALRSVRDDADRLSQLAEDLLLLSRIDEGRLPLRRETADLDELLAGVATRFGVRAEEVDRRIESDGHGIRVHADRLRLEQAAGNLVENAIRYGSGTVRLFGVEHDSYVEIHVTDEGEGIPHSFAPRAFERFSRADDSRGGGGGAGLGLAIVKAVAEAHGGTAGATRGAQGGADIWLSLLVDDAGPATPPARRRALRQALGRAARSRHGRVEPARAAGPSGPAAPSSAAAPRE